MKHLKLYLFIFSLFSSSIACAKEVTLSVTHPNAKYGIFSTYSLKVQPLNDGSNRVKLLENLIFIDAKGKKWTAPKGYVVDGATIPKVFQEFIGTPYGGQYVLASVIHDVAYDKRLGTWKEVHQVFYDAMLASGVEPRKAALMYMAVYEGSQRWGKNQNEHLSDEQVLNLLVGKKLEKKDVANLIDNVLQSLDIRLEESEGGLRLNIGSSAKK